MMSVLEGVRIDKWLWAVRICRTRQISSDLCKRGKIKINGLLVKPSREVKVGQIVCVQRRGIVWQYEVVCCIEKRVGAKTAVVCRRDLTPEKDICRMKLIRSQRSPSREKGMGRPTKKDRRDRDKIFSKEDCEKV